MEINIGITGLAPGKLRALLAFLERMEADHPTVWKAESALNGGSNKGLAGATGGTVRPSDVIAFGMDLAAPSRDVSTFTSVELAEQPDTNAAPPLDLSALRTAAPPTPFAPPAPQPIVASMPPAPVAIAPPPLDPLGQTQLLPEYDKGGMPWDGRIHASTRAKTADGCWRMRRNVPKEVVAEITEELRTAKAAPSSVPPPPPVVPAVPAVPAAPSATGMGFPQFLRLIAGRLGDDPNYNAEVLNKCNELGIPSLHALASRPDLVPEVARLLGLGQ